MPRLRGPRDQAPVAHTHCYQQKSPRPDSQMRQVQGYGCQVGLELLQAPVRTLRMFLHDARRVIHALVSPESDRYLVVQVKRGHL